MDVYRNPCVPSPCGQYAECRDNQGTATCSCLPSYFGTPPNCRPECTINPDCPSHLSCQQQRCRDPCPGACGFNALCTVINHNPTCQCAPGFIGNAFTSCHVPPPIVRDPPQISDSCDLITCGPNAVCNQGQCNCLPEFVGNPLVGCRPECVLSTECDWSKACVRNKCIDPCPGTCGSNAICEVHRHIAMCHCPPEMTGNAFSQCRPLPPAPVRDVIDPCQPSPCGPNAQCRNINGQAVCSCLRDFIGVPPSCRPECVSNAECPLHLACLQRHCRDPCPGVCGLNAECRVINHSPNCHCIGSFTGNPFAACHRPPPPPIKHEPIDPCQPSPCGANAECRVQGSNAQCSCLSGFIGTPPNCRPECVSNSDCPMNLACLNQKCRDPCPGVCGSNAECYVINHTPMCTCLAGQTGNPFVSCQVVRDVPEPQTPCVPSPCGANALCSERNGAGACQCLPEFYGNPYEGCRPECVLNSDCPSHLACLNQHCRDPCPGTCGINAECQVRDHLPQCNCHVGYQGNPYVYCSVLRDRKLTLERNIIGPDAYSVFIPTALPEPVPSRPCQPSPCGPNSQCRESNNQAICKCLPNFIGSPPACRPECTISSECDLTLACVQQHCVDPCPGVCGNSAQCRVINHSPHCSCLPGFTGDAISGCQRIRKTTFLVNSFFSFPNSKPSAAPAITHDAPNETPRDPCVPSPCGAFGQCRAQGNQAICSCLPGYYGAPPNCRPECAINPDCASHLACISEKCRDPCPGSCGLQAQCSVINHTPICSCPSGYEGNPFVSCQRTPPTPTPPLRDACNPSPCGSNAICSPGGQCSCLPDFDGNPYVGCRPECVLNTDCARDKACQRSKCTDPCPGACGIGAVCEVRNHIPTCNCPPGTTGNAFVQCTLVQCRFQTKNLPTIDTLFNNSLFCLASPVVPLNPCQPSPCGNNAQCREVNDQAVCSCLPGFFGVPPKCRPECTINSDCAPHLACLNQQCRDPCPGACGQFAQCQVIRHVPHCSCPAGFSGNAFFLCQRLPPPPPVQREPINPCYPSPCGPNAECTNQNEQAICKCLKDYIGTPPNCRPECITSSECPIQLACIGQKCKDPCSGLCGIAATCQVVSHVPSCICIADYIGDPYTGCYARPPIQREQINPCYQNPCGSNAVCRERGEAASCQCLPEYYGNPYEGCRPECVLNSDCSSHLACLNQHCRDPCPGSCAPNAQCQVVNHVPSCSCYPGYSGDPYRHCHVVQAERKQSLPSPSFNTCTNPQIYPQSALLCPPLAVQIVHFNPCQPSPCGPNSQCTESQGQAVCRCLPDYYGSPPACRPECTTNPECPNDKACVGRRCTDPCAGACGQNAICRAHQHRAYCSCHPGYTGDAFMRCQPLPPPQPIRNSPVIYKDPCVPSPCGQFAQCRVEYEQAVCSCLTSYYGTPPYCRPECTQNSDCPSHRACVNQRCVDPCPGACGLNARCDVLNHVPSCSCPEGYLGDPFYRCYPAPAPPPTPVTVVADDPCQPSPCGPNAQCSNGVCICLPLYQGDPYVGCRPECVLSTECPWDKACIRNRCLDPCPGTCGSGATCQVHNHVAMCQCSAGYQGNPFVLCQQAPLQAPVELHPCQPSPCGHHGECREVGSQAICTCRLGYYGSPPACRPECVSDPECPPSLACVNQKCRDPCPGACGHLAQCHVINHSPQCVCPAGYTGSPYSECHLIRADFSPVQRQPIDPCLPSPCGPHAQCSNEGGNAVCRCLTEYLGVPPYCRPECIANSECPSDRACINRKCQDPCPGLCGYNAICRTYNHQPNCVCAPGLVGNPFNSCLPPTRPEIPATPPTTAIQVLQYEEPFINGCEPNPCGANAQCNQRRGVVSCVCLPDYFGNPYEACRPECILNSDCPLSRACVQQKCRDPCPGTCGLNAECHVMDHLPQCRCFSGYTGNPLAYCSPVPIIQECKHKCNDKLATSLDNPNHMFPLAPLTPCDPSPCGPNAQCHPSLNEAVCSCLPEFYGTPPNCRPECTLNSECAYDKACVHHKCVDPCPGICGINADCRVHYHSPICYCISSHTGDPFTRCYETPKRKNINLSSYGVQNLVNINFANISLLTAVRPQIYDTPSPPYPVAIPDLVYVQQQQPGIVNIPSAPQSIYPTPQSPQYNVNYPSPQPSNPQKPGVVNIPSVPQLVYPSPQPPVYDVNYPTTSVSQQPGVVNIPSAPRPVPPTSQRPVFITSPGNLSPTPQPGVINIPSVSQPGYPTPQSPIYDANYPTTQSPIPQQPGVVNIPSVPSPSYPAPNPPVNYPTQPSPQIPVQPGVINIPSAPLPTTPPQHPPVFIPSPESPSPAPTPGVINIPSVTHPEYPTSQVPLYDVNYSTTPSPIPQKPGVVNIPSAPQPVHPAPNPPVHEFNYPTPPAVPQQPGVLNIPSYPTPVAPTPQSPIYIPSQEQPKPTTRPSVINVPSVPQPAYPTPQAPVYDVNYPTSPSVIPHQPGIVNIPSVPLPAPPVKQRPVFVPSPVHPTPAPQPGVVNIPSVAQPVHPTYQPPVVERPAIYDVYYPPPPSRPGVINIPSPPRPVYPVPQQPIYVPAPVLHIPAPRPVIHNIPSVPQPTYPHRNPPIQDVTYPAPQPSPPVPGIVNIPSLPQPVSTPTSGVINIPSQASPPISVPTPGIVNIPSIPQPTPQRPSPGIINVPSVPQPIPTAPSPGIINIPSVPQPLPSPTPGVINIPQQPTPPPLVQQPGIINIPSVQQPSTPTTQHPIQDVQYETQRPQPTPGVINIPSVPQPTYPTQKPSYQDTSYPTVQPKPPVSGIINIPSVPQPVPSSTPGVINLPSEPSYSAPIPKPGIINVPSIPEPIPSIPQNPVQEVYHDTQKPQAIPGVVNVPSAPQPTPGRPYYDVAKPDFEFNPCYPSPCGPYSHCHNRFGVAACVCLPNYRGTPPNCRPECVINSDCPSSLACINEKCRDPCPGSCAYNAVCRVHEHVPNCYCQTGYTGNPFISCQRTPIAPVQREPIEAKDPCYPSICGPNAVCNNGKCSCIPEYRGDPYVGCRPECVLNTDCARDKACIQQKCKNPCPGTCGIKALCHVYNHVATCSCPEGMQGDAFVRCDPKPKPQPPAPAPPTTLPAIVPQRAPINPCQPTPCGPNSQCRAYHEQAICYCLPSFIGTPPGCRPECTSNSDCPLDKYCLNLRCRDPCPGACGIRAICHVQNHGPLCVCPPHLTGNPLLACQPIGIPEKSTKQKDHLSNLTVLVIPPVERDEVNPCQPSPCGPNSKCQATSGGARCSCLPQYHGTPPFCRPECVNSADCPADKACRNYKCIDPCPGSCGFSALCRVVAHSPVCYCPEGYVGNAYTLCTRPEPSPPAVVILPCNPSPCGVNAFCQPHNNLSVCQCLPGYYGNPSEICRPECTVNSDCPSHRACMSEKCRDPCPGVCGLNALCQVINHSPVCECHTGHVGNPYHSCRIPQRERKKKSPYFCYLKSTLMRTFSSNNNALLALFSALPYYEHISQLIILCDILGELLNAELNPTTS